MVKVQNVDKDFREFKMDRKGKEYSYIFESKNLPVGNRIDFYYTVYKKNAATQQLTDANNMPFYTIVQEAAPANATGNDKGKKK